MPTLLTVGELMGRRERKKARTRDQIRTVAHELFARHGFDCVTIADIAREADVAVQTVFNHFATKEELFFDGRTPWVEGAAAAVRGRPASVPPLTALRAYLVELARTLVGSMCTAERRSYVTTIEASDALRAYERELIFEQERRLAGVLLEAWSAGPDGDPGAPADPGTVALVTAAAWVSTHRVLVLDARLRLCDEADPAETADTVATELDRMLERMEAALLPVPGRADHRFAPTGRSRQVQPVG